MARVSGWATVVLIAKLYPLVVNTLALGLIICHIVISLTTGLGVNAIGVGTLNHILKCPGLWIVCENKKHYQYDQRRYKHLL